MVHSSVLTHHLITRAGACVHRAQQAAYQTHLMAAAQTPVQQVVPRAAQPVVQQVAHSMIVPEAAQRVVQQDVQIAVIAQ